MNQVKEFLERIGIKRSAFDRDEYSYYIDKAGIYVYLSEYTGRVDIRKRQLYYHVTVWDHSGGGLYVLKKELVIKTFEKLKDYLERSLVNGDFIMPDWKIKDDEPTFSYSIEWTLSSIDWSKC